MRLSEKTIELTFCHQFSSLLPHNAVWFGLTQRQERIAGFDACTRLNGRLLILQFKASSKVLTNGSRRFLAPHHQMEALRRRCKTERGIFYVFPLIGRTSELSINSFILAHCWFLDLSILPFKIPQPFANNGSLRRNGLHYIDVVPGWAEIHSKTVGVKLINSKEILAEEKPYGIQIKKKDNLSWIPKIFSRHAYAIILPS